MIEEAIAKSDAEFNKWSEDRKWWVHRVRLVCMFLRNHGLLDGAVLTVPMSGDSIYLGYPINDTAEGLAIVKKYEVLFGVDKDAKAGILNSRYAWYFLDDDMRKIMAEPERRKEELAVPIYIAIRFHTIGENCKEYTMKYTVVKEESVQVIDCNKGNKV